MNDGAFFRNNETGILVFRALREFLSKADRDKFVREERLEWTKTLEDQKRR